MSRIAKKPVSIPKGVDVTIDGNLVKIKGPKGELSREIHQDVKIEKVEAELRLVPVVEDKGAVAMAGTMRSLVNNMVVGVAQGQVPGDRIVQDGVDPGFFEPNAFPVPRPVVVLFVIFAEGADVHVENGRLEVAAGMLLGDHGVLDGVHAANR